MPKERPVPTYAVLGVGGHRMVTAKGQISFVDPIHSHDGKNPNRPIPNWLVVKDDLAKSIPEKLLNHFKSVPITAYDGKEYLGIYEHVLTLSREGKPQLELDEETFQRFVRNAEALLGQTFGNVISEIGLRDPFTQPIVSCCAFFVANHFDGLKSKLIVPLQLEF